MELASGNHLANHSTSAMPLLTELVTHRVLRAIDVALLTELGAPLAVPLVIPLSSSNPLSPIFGVPLSVPPLSSCLALKFSRRCRASPAA
jgi:hypothetical protein